MFVFNMISMTAFKLCEYIQQLNLNLFLFFTFIFPHVLSDSVFALPPPAGPVLLLQLNDAALFVFLQDESLLSVSPPCWGVLLLL